MNTSISPEPAALPPEANEPWRPQSRPVRLAVALLVSALTVAIAAGVTGAIAPDVKVRATTQRTVTGSTTPPRTVVLGMTLDSYRTMAVRIEGVGESIPGMELISTSMSSSHPVADEALEPFEPMTIDRDAPQPTVELTYRVTNCERVPDRHIGMAIRVRTGAGLKRTLHSRLVIAARPDAPAQRSYEGDDPYAEPWQITLARPVCPA